MLDTAVGSEHTDTRWRIELFGGLRVERAGVCVTHFRTQKSALLLAYLTLSCDAGSRRQRLHQRDDLAYLLWPESHARSARDGLRHALSLVRRVLEPEGTPHGSILMADRACVHLNPGAITTDVAEFEAALREAARADSSEEGARWLARAVDLYHGELLAGHFDDWVLQERQWLAERYFQALGELLSSMEAAGAFHRALEYARRGVRADPLREEAHRDLIRLLAAAGQPDAALRQYQALERLTAEKLGVEPSPELRALILSVEKGRGRQRHSGVPHLLVHPSCCPPLLHLPRPAIFPCPSAASLAARRRLRACENCYGTRRCAW